jgi:hypothetical protein
MSPAFRMSIKIRSGFLTTGTPRGERRQSALATTKPPAAYLFVE